MIANFTIGRAKDLPEERRVHISQASKKYNFFLPSAYSLRRQFIRGVVRDQERAFYSSSTCMGDEAQAKLHAEAFEMLVRDWLHSQGIPFLSENVSTEVRYCFFLFNVSISMYEWVVR